MIKCFAVALFIGAWAFVTAIMLCSAPVDKVINATLRSLALLTLITTLYIYFFNAPKLAYKTIHFPAPTAPNSNGMYRYSFYFQIYSPGKITDKEIFYGSPVKIHSATVQAPFGFIPSAKEEWSKEISEAALFDDNGEKSLAPVIVGELPLGVARIRLPLKGIKYHFYTGQKGGPLNITIKIVGSADPTDQGILSFLRDVFKYTMIAEINLPTNNEETGGLFGDFKTKFF